MFGGIKDTFKKSEAASIVQSLLEQQVKLGFLNLDAGKIANAIVGLTWDSRSQFLDGKKYPRPSKYGLAAFSIASSLDRCGSDRDLFLALMAVLPPILERLEGDRLIGSANTTDMRLALLSSNAYLSHARHHGLIDEEVEPDAQ